MSYFDMDRLAFYRMQPQELRAARKLRLKEIRAFRKSIVIFGSMIAGYVSVILAVIAIMGIYIPFQLLGTGVWQGLIVAGWTTFICLVIAQRPALNRPLEQWTGQTTHLRNTVQMHRSSIKQIDQRLKEHAITR